MTRILAALLLAVAASIPAFAHSWYPTRCCSDRDCHPVNADEVEERGDFYFFKKLNISFPKDKAEPGRDENFHICIIPMETGPYVLCVFKPYSGT